MISNLPKVLIVSRGVWDETQGTSSTLTNLFQNYEADKLAHIYIETKTPNTQCCRLFFQISEVSLIHKIFHWRTKTGFIINTETIDNVVVDEKKAAQEENTMIFVRKHRLIIFNFIREILWLLNGWKSKELKKFIADFNPDLIWLDGSPLPLMNRLHCYVLDVAKKPASIFMQDDVYTYESCSKNIWSRLYKCLLRTQVRRVVSKCDNMFVASLKMKREYDEIFDVNSTFITKGIDLLDINWQSYNVHRPIRMTYLGQVIYGRIYSLIAVANALKNINKAEVKLQFEIYTNNQISEDLKRQLLNSNGVKLMPPVTYPEVPSVINNSDVVVFVESFEKKYKNIARLSFSTKISDYFASGRAILAIGPSDNASIEYFRDEDAALIATNEEQIQIQLNHLIQDDYVSKYAKKAYNCGYKNHEKQMMDEKVFGKLIELANIIC